MGLLCWHLFRIVRIWRATRLYSIYSLLWVLGAALWLLAHYFEIYWLQLGAVIAVCSALIWRFSFRGRLKAMMEGMALLSGIEHNDYQEFLRKNEKREAEEQDRRDVVDAFEEAQMEWKEKFEVQSNPQPITIPIDLSGSTAHSTTMNNQLLRFEEGAFEAVLSGWEIIKRNGDISVFVSFQICDREGQGWEGACQIWVPSIFAFGFSVEDERLGGDFVGWTEVDKPLEHLFAEQSLMAGVESSCDSRDQFELTYAGNSYSLRIKHQCPSLDLAYDDQASLFYCRVSNIHAPQVNGVSLPQLPDDDPRRNRSWGEETAEPVVFSFAPHLMFPRCHLTESYEEFHPDSNYLWEEIIFSRCDEMNGLNPSKNIYLIPK